MTLIEQCLTNLTFTVHFDMQLSQEIGLIPEEPNYVNPFRAAAKVGGRREKRGGDGKVYREASG